MNNCKLEFKPVIENEELVASSVLEAIKSLSNKEEFLVAEIDPEFFGGEDLCSNYNVDPKMGANCLIAKGVRGENETIVAMLVPVGYKYDMSKTVRKKIGARMVSVAPLDFVLEKTGMEYGSITPIGLPNDWLLFIDPKVIENESIIIGSGLKKSKLCIPSKSLLSLNNAELLEGLAKEN